MGGIVPRFLVAASLENGRYNIKQQKAQGVTGPCGLLIQRQRAPPAFLIIPSSHYGAFDQPDSRAFQTTQASGLLVYRSTTEKPSYWRISMDVTADGPAPAKPEAVPIPTASYLRTH